MLVFGPCVYACVVRVWCVCGVCVCVCVCGVCVVLCVCVCGVCVCVVCVCFLNNLYLHSMLHYHGVILDAYILQL